MCTIPLLCGTVYPSLGRRTAVSRGNLPKRLLVYSGYRVPTPCLSTSRFSSGPG